MEKLVVKNICKTYQNKNGTKNLVLNDISFSLEKGECISIIGESGCGKSTLMKIILGLIKPNKGDVLIDGDSIINISQKEFYKKRTIIQGVFQDASGSLNEYLSTYDNIQEALINLTNLTRNQRKDKVNALINKLRIKKELLKIPVKLLSGGEKRRIALLRSLLVQPKYLLLDEVVSGLDSISSNAVLETLDEYKNIYGCSYLFVTHNLNCAYKLSERIIELDHGNITRIAQRNN